MLQQLITFMLTRRQDEEKGATATEYALLVAFIAFIIIVGVTAFGEALSTWFTGLGDTVGNDFNNTSGGGGGTTP